MISGIPIPPGPQKSLRKISSLENNAFTDLLLALAEVRNWSDAAGAASKIKPRAKALTIEDISTLITSLTSLEVGRNSLDLPVEAFSSRIAAFLRRIDDFGNTSEQELADRIRRLLELPSLQKIGKALALLSEHQRVMLNSRIFTDLRPVFSQVQIRPDTAVLVHTLKIEYHEGGEHKSFFVGMDANDIKSLRESCERAENKAKTLFELLDKAQVTIVEMPPTQE